jgi:catechol 2,3-dioxygenase-like lactoylglutathione lyase family enzyme
LVGQGAGALSFGPERYAFLTENLEIDHVQIAIPKGGEILGRAFFGDLLGLTEVEKPINLAARGGLWFVAGSHQIHLGVDADFRAAKKAHVALTTAFFDKLRARLEAAGYIIQNDDVSDGRKRFFTHDPFGNRIEFIDRNAHQ